MQGNKNNQIIENCKNIHKLCTMSVYLDSICVLSKFCDQQKRTEIPLVANVYKTKQGIQNDSVKY